MTISKSEFIGTNGAAFERVGLAFEALGYRTPRPDTGSDGAYALNIVEQYRADLSEDEALAVIEYGLRNTRAALRAWVKDAGTRDGLRLSDVR